METKNIIIAVVCLINIIIITFKFFLSKKIRSDETKIYGYLLLAMLAESISGIVLFLTMNSNQLIINIFNGLYLATMTVWIALFSLYMIRISEPNDRKYQLIKYIAVILNSVAVVCAFVLPRSISLSERNELYATGEAITSMYIYSGIYILVISYYLIKNFKKILDKRYLPILILLLSVLMLTIVQNQWPGLFLVTPSHSYIVFIMFFTIENPDVKMLKQMEMSKIQAEKANNAKSDFLSSMSHEIRTPLNAIVGLSEDIADYKDQVPAQVVEDTEDIRAASQTLLEIVGNILDLNKIESQKMEIQEEEYNPKEEIETLAKIDATRIGDKPIDFKMNIAEDLPYELTGDKTHVKQILNNLLSNAFKYTEKGEVCLNVRCINQNDICNMMISVRDTGRGIKAENINKLFTKFERLGMDKNTTTEGTGLGLAITKSLVEMMGGRINVESRFGQGSIFVVNIPQKIKQLENPLTDTQVIHLNEIEKAQDTSVYGQKKILIVDDNKLNIKVARKALQDFNFEIEECYDGYGCLEKVKLGNEYDLILMDIMMPNMSGETAMEKLKENPSFNIPTIALTADAIAGAKEKYLSEGFVDYIAKPFSKAQIKEKLDMVFKK
ncbi:MAG: response regulator [Bacilli bacterium]|nr:response regulator [Bacilli bacterium]